MGKRRDWLIWPVLSETDACNLLLVVVDPSSGLPKNNVFSYFANLIFLFVVLSFVLYSWLLSKTTLWSSIFIFCWFVVACSRQCISTCIWIFRCSSFPYFDLYLRLYFHLYMNFQIALYILRGLLLICSGMLPSVSAPIVSSSRSKSKKTQFSKDKIFSWIVHFAPIFSL